MSYERTTKDSLGYIANKFAENPGHFAATILRMYWDMEKQRDQYKAERDTLIDDIAVLKANISRLERENDKLRAEKFGLKLDLIESIKLSEGFLKRYEQLTNHIRMKAEHNPGVSRYIDLVNYIDRLERD